ncbi:hypothetical protein [Kutzneria sp. 744]|uniref:hypothetical protein n=1 Tax=Kutzneria sp. (strain 744) TaxID=345341 RepID=UPI0003EED078|nr:hypothetical protein [Kutzneria sp. 744]EWM10909.1 serine/threonine protein kinase [Kutzneria sp. 744]
MTLMTVERPVETGSRQYTKDWRPQMLTGAAVLCWLIGFREIDPTTLGSLGLVPALSPLLMVAYPLLVAAFTIELLKNRRTAVLTLITVVAIFAVYGLQPAVEPAARLPVAWLHSGFANYIGAHGDVLHDFDTRFSWPGFFALLAFLTEASGLHDTSVLLNWAPVLLSGLAVLGVRAIAVAVVGPGRASWIAAWIFLVANWTEQDYASPQGTTYILLLAALAITFQHLVSPSPLAVPRADIQRPPAPNNSAGDRLRAEGLVVLLAMALAPTHQLTPYMLGGLLIVLVLWGRLWPRWLPVVVLALAVGWFVLAAREFWIGQLSVITGSIGDLNSSVSQGIGQRFVGNAGRQAILLTRIGIMGGATLLAAAGFLVLRRRGSKSLVLPALALASFGLAVLQPYGGEIFIRCYLFALPFFAVLGGIALDALTKRSYLTGIALGLSILATVAVRGGNDAYVAFTKADVDVVQKAYDLARDGQSIGTVVSYAPLEWQRVGDVRQVSAEDGCTVFPNGESCVLKAKLDFLVINHAQDAYGTVYFGAPPGWTGALADRLIADGYYERVASEGDSQLLQRKEGKR